MNREILFKAKRIDNGEWVEGQYAYITNPLAEDGKPIKHLICNGTNIFNDLIDPDTLCQYTGLTDKNGKKIWENDILRRDGYWDIRIEFENGVFMVRNTDKVQYINRVVYTPISIFDINVYEVIGNIFDNPELLEVE